MPLQFHPKPGTVLLCDYQPGFQAPEMVKRRPVIVVSPRLRARNKLCAVVPLSLTPPDKVMQYHCELTFPVAFPAPNDAASHWVKGDMINTVAFHRLRLMHSGKDQYGKRTNVMPVATAEQLAQVRRCVQAGLGILT